MTEKGATADWDNLEHHVTAVQVYEEAQKRHEAVGPQELGDVYQELIANELRLKRGVYYTPQPAAAFMSRFSLGQALSQVGPEPGQVLRVVACDPACGAGIFLVEAAWFLATQYAGRLVDGNPDQLIVEAVLPRVILECIFGMDIDPVAVELARLSLSLATDGVLPPSALERHIICGNPLEGESPPAMDDRTGPPVTAPPEFDEAQMQ
jgi:type I restriction-modification system DNA methylase subunit